MVCGLIGLAGCEDKRGITGVQDELGDEPAPRAPTVASVSVSPASAAVTVGSTQQLEVLPKDVNGASLSGRTTVWSTGSSAIATVDGTGSVRALGAGRVLITATVDGVSGQATIDVSAATTPPPVTSPSSSNPLAGARFWVDPTSNARKQAGKWASTRPADAAQMEKIAAQPNAVWIGDWFDPSEVRAATHERVTNMIAAGTLPVLVLYNIPARDCGSYSAGGANSAAAYRTWIADVANGIANRKTVVILEPDAISDADCLSAADREVRFSLIRDAVITLKAKGALVYIDAGHPDWNTAAEEAALLVRAGIANAQGFTLNVSNFNSNASNASYGEAVSRLVGGKHFLVDTSRNGLGAGSTWCNPAGRALGTAPTAVTGYALIDAFLWIKAPGESDGTCNGGPTAGVWWPEYALGLAQRTTTTMMVTN